ncbi:hypothetical protein MPSEU_000247400 [Mayamaea pseudoterrestris]|nr:hypothetical protein MPSEU_000247400 [Mayamaea pseudoterrestris]
MVASYFSSLFAVLFQDFADKQPILMDFGSCGSLLQSISDRRQVMNIVENAAEHTTMPYRPPELFEGGVRAGDADLDYRKVDVWSLGCTFFAMLYGASPSEAEFTTSGRNMGKLRVVECSQLKVIGPVPTPPLGSPAANWYSASTQQLIDFMLTQDRHQRPELNQVLKRVEQLIREMGGVIEPEVSHRRANNYQDNVADDDGIALLSTNRLL